MSGDQLASSFGDPNAQPPTPKQTPTSTSTALPSPVFETPKNNQEHFDDSGGWTPRFAEEYSVFNSTPGNLKATHGPFVEFTPVTTFAQTPSANCTSLKRPLSAGGIAAEIATHVNHFALNPNLPPVEPSRRLPSSPTPLGGLREYSPEDERPQSSSRERSAKKPRRGTAAEDLQTQTATPPPSARKGERKLAPKVGKDSMQNDQGFGQDFMGTPQQPDMAAFAATHDMFGYPMSAPATAPASFWDPMTGMELDFSGGNVFQTPTPSQRQMDFDWNANAHLFQDTTPVPASGQESAQPQKKRERPIASKASMPNVSTGTTENSGVAGSFQTTTNDPFGIAAGGVLDPGLLFSQSQSSTISAAAFSNAVSQAGPSTTTALAESASVASSTTTKGRTGRGTVQRSFSYKESAKQLDRAAISSPIKPSSNRPGLQRSFSENRGKRSLPPLAPAIRPQPQASGSGVAAGRPPSSRQSGRTSPLKQHHRLSSLTSIPESGGPRTRTSVKFTIDARGRAHAETTVIVDEPSPGGIHRRRVSRDSGRKERDLDSESGDSSTDDEPIIIPSRNSSFALPDPRKPVGSIFHNSKKSFREASASSRAAAALAGGGRRGGSPSDESDAETVLNDSADQGGDATSELRKMVEERHKRSGQGPGSQRSQRFASGSFGNFEGNMMSPTSLTESSLPTPSTDTRGDTVRCVCHRNDAEGAGDMFMVQCEACEMWLHGKCINITRREMPPVYICAFCANTPNMRGGRMRNISKGGTSRTGTASSPLAHKSFKFR